MIYRLRRKFILVCTLSLAIVFGLIFSLICVLSAVSNNRTLDTLTDAIASGNGKFPDSFDASPGELPHNGKDHGLPDSGGSVINGETRFSTRHFTVWFDGDGNAVQSNTEAIHTVDESTAREYAAEVLTGGKERGWYRSFRYKVYRDGYRSAVTFVDASMNRAQSRNLLLAVFVVLALSFSVVLLLIVLLSRRVVRPAAESYSKQKQFITDAGHELKTPLTLILADLDIAESELGKSEWLDDIRAESERMTDLVSQMVTLTRMDEDQPSLVRSRMSLSDTVLDTVSEFSCIAAAKGLQLTADVDPDIELEADEASLRRLVSILLDNAVKYCDPSGEIKVTLVCRHRVCLSVENSYSAVDTVELNRLFDRFFRADKARTAGGGFGIGLSIAKAIAAAHRADIEAYRPDSGHIGFRVKFRK